MPVYKDGDKYYFMVSYKYLGKYKKYKSKRFDTKREATKEEAAYRLANKQKGDSLTIKALVKEYAEEYKERVQPSSFKAASVMDRYILDLIGDLRADKFGKNELSQFRNEINKLDISARRKNLIIGRLRSAFRLAAQRYDIDNHAFELFSNFKDVKLEKKKMEYYTHNQFLHFIECADDIRMKNLFITLYYGGFRIGEANALTFNDYKDGVISITKSVSTKLRDANGEYLVTAPKTKASIRENAMPLVVRDAIEEMRAYWSLFEGYSNDWHIFGGLYPLPDTTVQKAKNRYCDNANLPRIKVHSFRHSCACFLINEANANVLTVQHWLGHENASMTLDVYSHFFEDAGKEVVDKINLITKKSS